MVKPGIIAGSMLVFIPWFGAFVTPALLGGGKTLMMGNVIQMQFGAARNWPFGAALSVVLLAAMLIVLMATAGAVRQMRTSLRFPHPARVSGGKKAAPLGESGGAGQFVVIAGLEMALRGEVVVDQGMDGGELL